MIRRKSIAVSDPADAGERQADELAERVVGQRSAAPPEDGGWAAGHEVQVQAGTAVTPGFQGALERSKGTGRPLESAVRREVESKLGIDFSGVNVHADGDAHAMCTSIGARAFAHGADVYFREGEFDPGTDRGKRLLVHELVHTGQSRSGGVIRRQFDPQTATQRIKGTKNINQFRLVDADGVQLAHDAEDAARGYAGPIYLPEGTLVSKLAPNPKDPRYIHVVAWHNMKYREGYIHRSAFAGEYQGGSPFDVSVFINDAYHAAHRARLLLRDKAKDDPFFAHMRTQLKDVEAMLASYESGELEITAEMLQSIQEQDRQALKIDPSDKPGTLDRLSGAMFQAADPTTSEGSKLSENTLFVPLTDTWFKSDETLKEHYDSVIFTSGNFNRLAGHSGEGIEDAGNIAEWFGEFAVLRDLVKGRPAADSPEGKWLTSITPAVQKRTRRMIFISGGTWPDLTESGSRYAEYVAVSTSFGPVQANPLMLLMMHEVNVNTSAGLTLMGEDSHIAPGDTKSAWETASAGGFADSIATSSKRLDQLFQAQSGIALTALSRMLKQIKSMQQPKLIKLPRDFR